MAGKNRKKTTTVGFVSLGCPKNTVDSERMLAEIAQAGFLVCAEPDNVDVVVINTCGFIAPAKAEALEAIKRAVACKASGTIKKVIAAGCLAERLGAELFSQADGIDAIVGLGQRDAIAEIIEKTLNSNQPAPAHRWAGRGLAEGGPAIYLDHLCGTIHDDRARMLITPCHRPYLRISEGCDHKCSFCTIPAIRGPFRSKPKEIILAEAAELVSGGAVELNIIAQDTSWYGRDLKIKNGLATLAAELEKIPELKWIRLMYLSPTGINEKLIETVAKSEKIVHYFDIPIQHINDKILKDMRRPDSKEHIRRLIEKLRSAIWDVVLRTTVMVGFPGETGQQFTELLDFIRWAEFDALGCFKYYAEAGTAAAQMPQQVPEHIKDERFEEMMLTQQEIAFAKNKKRIGTELSCIVDSADNNGTGEGRFYGQAPDVDSICIIEGCSAKPGQFINTKVVDTKDYDLVVEQI